MGSHSRISPTKHLVEMALAERHTSLAEFIAAGEQAGKNIRTLAEELRYVTGVPLHWRTLYRWLENLEKVS